MATATWARRCVRCGALPPDRDAYLCTLCARDPETTYEQRSVEEYVEGYVEQRRALVEVMGWRGAWWEPEWPRS